MNSGFQARFVIGRMSLRSGKADFVPFRLTAKLFRLLLRAVFDIRCFGANISKESITGLQRFPKPPPEITSPNHLPNYLPKSPLQIISPNHLPKDCKLFNHNENEMLACDVLQQMNLCSKWLMPPFMNHFTDNFIIY